MSISRRSFISGSIAASVFIALWDIDPSKAEVKIGDNPKDKKLLMKMCRDIYPHDRFPEGPYERTANDVLRVLCSTASSLDATVSILEDV